MRNKYDTHYVKNGETTKEWFVVDATCDNLGRLASKIASILRGKHKATFQPSVDNGDNVIVTNTSRLKISGKKETDKEYYWYTGFPGGIRNKNFETMQHDSPGRVLMLAVKRMLPKGRLGRAMIKKLHLYKDGNHVHSAQMPKNINI